MIALSTLSLPKEALGRLTALALSRHGRPAASGGGNAFERAAGLAFISLALGAAVLAAALTG